MAGAVEGEYFVGSKAEELRGLLKLKRPIEHGIVTDWTEMEHIWNHTYSELKIQSEDVRSPSLRDGGFMSLMLVFVATAPRSSH